MWDKVTQSHQTLCCVFQNVIIVLASFCVASSGYSVVATDTNNIFKHNYVILNYEAIILVLLILLPLLCFHIICKTGLNLLNPLLVLFWAFMCIVDSHMLLLCVCGMCVWCTVAHQWHMLCGGFVVGGTAGTH